MHETWPQGYETFFMLISAEHEILNAHKYKNKLILLFFLFLNVKMPTIVGILTFIVGILTFMS